MKLKQAINAVNLLLKSQTPPVVYLKLIEWAFNRYKKKKYDHKKIEFKAELSGKRYSTDWFTGNVAKWHEVFNFCNLDFHKKHNILEIGSFEGLSGCFLLHTFPNSTVTCVDTWSGADEHSTIDMQKIESNFDFNTLPYTNRLIKYKGTSFSFFEKTDIYKETYDLIYIDGSHYADDVMVDGLRCFSMLKKGGVIIFDDYLWDGYRQKSANPAIAINALVKMKSEFLKVKFVTTQLVVTKIASESHEVPPVLL